MNAYAIEDLRIGLGAFELSVERCRLETGRIHVIVGPNGCGKTTLLDTLSLSPTPDTGHILLNGTPVERHNQRALLETRREIGYLTQSPYLFDLTVRENIAYGLSLRGTPRAKRDARVDTVMEQLALAHLAQRHARTLSGGEAQRVAIARVLVLGTPILLLDEPTAAVDRQHVHLVEALIRAVNEQTGTTVVLTTHASDQAYRLSRTPISMVGGRISRVRYENVFMGDVDTGADGALSMDLAPGITLQMADGPPGRGVAAIDPEDVILSREPLASSALNHFQGRVTRVEEAYGKSLRVFVNVGVVFCALITQRSYDGLTLAVGERVWVTFKANAVRLIT